MRRPGPSKRAFHGPPGRGDISRPTRFGQRAGQFDGAALDPAGNQAREHLQHRRRAAFFRHRAGATVIGHLRRVPRMPEPDTIPASSAGPKSLARPDGATIVYEKLAGATPGVVFLGGFLSDMTGTKALFLEGYCRERGRAYVRFDYF